MTPVKVCRAVLAAALAMVALAPSLSAGVGNVGTPEERQLIGQKVWFVPHSGCLSWFAIERRLKLPKRVYPNSTVPIRITAIAKRFDGELVYEVSGPEFENEVLAKSLVGALTQPTVSNANMYERTCFFTEDPEALWLKVRRNDGEIDTDIGHNRDREIQRLDEIDLLLLNDHKRLAAPAPMVSIGMTSAEVLTKGWGKPLLVNTTITAKGTREQWVYGHGSYLYFQDGILTAIQK